MNIVYRYGRKSQKPRYRTSRVQEYDKAVRNINKLSSRDLSKLTVALRGMK